MFYSNTYDLYLNHTSSEKKAFLSALRFYFTTDKGTNISLVKRNIPSKVYRVPLYITVIPPSEFVNQR